MSEEEHGVGLAEEEEIVTVPQRKGGKSGQYLYLLLVIFAIIASKSVSCFMYRSTVLHGLRAWLRKVFQVFLSARAYTSAYNILY